MGRAHVRLLKQRPDIGAAMTAGLAEKQRFKVRKPDAIGPAIGGDNDGMRTFVIAAIEDEQGRAPVSRISPRVIF